MPVAWDQFEAVDEPATKATDWSEFEPMEAAQPATPAPEPDQTGMVGGFVRGANLGVGGILKGVAAISQDFAPTAIPENYDELGNPVSPTTPEEIDQRNQTLAAARMKNLQADPLYQAGQYVGETGQQIKAPEGLPGKAGEMAGGMVPVVLTGPAAPLTIGVQSYGETLDSEFQKAKQAGLSDGDAAERALDTALKSGATQAAIWSVLPGPMRNILGRATGQVGEGAVKQFLANRAAGAVEGAALGTASAGAQNLITGRPVTENLGAAALGMGAVGAFMPWSAPARRGPTARPEPVPIPEPATKPTTGENNASENAATAEVHGDVREQPEVREPAMPAQESGAGVQPGTEAAPGEVPLKDNVPVPEERLGLDELKGNGRDIEAAVVKTANEAAPAGLDWQFIKDNIADMPKATLELLGERLGGTNAAVRALVNELRRTNAPEAVLAKWHAERDAGKNDYEAAKDSGDYQKIQVAGLRKQFANEALEVVGNHGERLGLGKDVQARAKELRERPTILNNETPTQPGMGEGGKAGEPIPNPAPEAHWLGKPLTYWDNVDVSKLTPVQRQRIAKSLGVENLPKPIREAINKRVREIRANPPKAQAAPEPLLAETKPAPVEPVQADAGSGTEPAPAKAAPTPAETVAENRERSKWMQAFTVSKVNAEILESGKMSNGKPLTGEDRARLQDENAQYKSFLDAMEEKHGRRSPFREPTEPPAESLAPAKESHPATTGPTTAENVSREEIGDRPGAATTLGPEASQAKIWMEQQQALLQSGKWPTGNELSAESRAALAGKVKEYQDFIAGKAKEMPESLNERAMIKADKRAEPAPAPVQARPGEAEPWLKVPEPDVTREREAVRTIELKRQQLQADYDTKAKEFDELKARIMTGSRYNRRIKKSTPKAALEQYETLKRELMALSDQRNGLDLAVAMDRNAVTLAKHAEGVNNASLPLIQRIGAHVNLYAEAGKPVPRELSALMDKLTTAEILKRFPDASAEEVKGLRGGVERAARLRVPLDKEFELDPNLNVHNHRAAELAKAVNGPGAISHSDYSPELQEEINRYNGGHRTAGNNEPLEKLSREDLDALTGKIASETAARRQQMAEQQEEYRRQKAEQDAKEAKMMSEAQAVADSANRTGTRGGRSAKDVRTELVGRIKGAIDEMLEHGNVQLKQNADGEYVAHDPDANNNAAAFGSIEPAGDKLRVTAYRIGFQDKAITATVATRAEGEWFIKAMAGEAPGNAVIAVPGDGVYKLVRSGDNLLKVWRDAQRLDVSSGNPEGIRTGGGAQKPPQRLKTTQDFEDAVRYHGLHPLDTLADKSNLWREFAQKFSPEAPEKLTVLDVRNRLKAEREANEAKEAKTTAEAAQPETETTAETPPENPEEPGEKGPGIIGMGGAVPGESSLPTIEDQISGGPLAPEEERGEPLRTPETGAVLSGWHQALNDFKGWLGAVAGETFPRTTRVSQRLGELGARWVSSRIAAKPMAQVFAADVLGDSHLEPKDFGAALTEDNLRSIKNAFEEKADEAENREELISDLRGELENVAERAQDGEPEARKEANQIRKEIARLSKLTDEDAARFREQAKNVRSFIGEKHFPFESERQYQNFLDDPRVQEAVARHRDLWRAVVEPQYKEAMMYDPEMELPSRGLQTGARINLKAVREGDELRDVTGGGGAGNLLNTLRRKSPFGVPAKGTGEAYHLNYYDLMENTFGRQLEVANKNRFETALVDSGQAVIAKPGQTILIQGRRAESFPLKRQRLVTPGGGGVQQNKALYINPRLAREYRIGADVDAKPPQNLVTRTFSAMNTAAIAGLTDATVHLTNLVSALATLPSTSGRLLHDALLSAVPGRPDAFIAVGRALAKGFGDNRAQLASLAEIGALRQNSYLMRKGDPWSWRHAGHDVIHWVDEATRLALDDAYKRMAQDGLVENSETARREFVNQVGQYNRRAQSFYKRLFRDTGVGPFVTAGTTFNTLGVRGLTLNPGVKASSGPAALALRGTMLAKLAGTVGTIAVLNYLLTKNKEGGGAAGRPGVPLGAIDFGTNDKNGRPQYLSILGMIGAARGLRVTGARGFVEAKRRGLPTSVALDMAGRDIINSAIAPWAGPPVRFGLEATTGYSPAVGVGREFPVVPPGQSQRISDTKNAILNINPVVAGLKKAQEPGATGLSEVAKSQLPRFTLQPGKPQQMMNDYPGIVRRAQANAYIDDVIGRARKMEPATRKEFLLESVRRLEDARDRQKALKEFRFRRVL